MRSENRKAPLTREHILVTIASLMDFDYGTLEKMSGTYTTSHLSPRTNDIVWRLKTKDDSWYYVYVFTEFQSKNDKWMAARIAEYVAELRMELIRNGIVKDDELLPPILPIVLYRGVSRWTASKTLNCIQIALPEPLSDKKEEYVLIDIHRLAEESLEGEKDDSINLLPHGAGSRLG